MKKKYVYLLLVLIVLAAAWTRFSPVLWERDMWYDEAFTGILLKAPFSEMNQMIFDDVHPPLYYWLAKPWAAMFGYTPAGIRLFSLILGLATVASVFVIGKRFFNVKAGLLAAAVTAFSPFAVEYSQEARMYSLFGLLFLWSVWFFYRALETNSMKHWIVWGILGGLSFYTHYLALFFFILFYVTYVLYQKIFNKKTCVQSLLGQKEFWVGVGIIFVFFLTWFKIFFIHMMKGNLSWIDPSHLSDIPRTLQIFFFGHPPGTGGVPWSNEFIFFFDGTSAGLLIFALLLVLFVIGWKKDIKRKESLILLMMSLGTLLFLILLSQLDIFEMNGTKMGIKLYVARYFMPAAVLVYVLLSGLVVMVFKRRWIWIVLFGLYGLMLLMIKPPIYAQGWNRVWINQEELIGNKTVVTSNAFDYTSARYYLGVDRIKYYNKGNPTEDFSGWVVVGNENRITDPNEIVNNANMVIVDGSCDWSDHGIELEQIQQLSNVSICEIVK